MTNTYALKGKKVLITGANGQLGSGLVEAFLLNGAEVCATDVQGEVSPALAARLAERGLAEYSYRTLDVTEEASIRAVVDAEGPFDIAVNNAGIAVFTPFEERTADELDQVMDVNVKGTILCSKVVAEGMAAKGKGRIINIGSMYGVVSADKRIYGDSGRNSSEIYAATKAGVIHLTRYLATYLADKHITVNAVSPGGIFNNQKEYFVERYVDKTPAGRMANTDDIANAVLFLASDDSEYITGQNLTVDGGFTLNQ